MRKFKNKLVGNSNTNKLLLLSSRETFLEILLERITYCLKYNCHIILKLNKNNNFPDAKDREWRLRYTIKIPYED
jgi:hypothetical protein